MNKNTGVQEMGLILAEESDKKMMFSMQETIVWSIKNLLHKNLSSVPALTKATST